MTVDRPPARSLLAWLATALVMFAVAGTTPAHAAAAPVQDCTTSTGVILAVDFGHWGGPVLRACGTTPTTGYDLLNQGGWTSAGDAHDGPAFVCRIGYAGFHGGTAYPTPAEDPCIRTPPAGAYWSSWTAAPGQSTWSYSQVGAMTFRPGPGSVVLWTFGATDVAGTQGQPGFSPDSVRAHNAAVVTTPSPTAAPRSTPTESPSTATAPASSAPPGRTTPVGAVRSVTATSPAGAPVTAAATCGGSASPCVTDAPPTRAVAASKSSGHAAQFVLVVLLCLIAVGLVAVLRRPDRES